MPMLIAYAVMSSATFGITIKDIILLVSLLKHPFRSFAIIDAVIGISLGIPLSRGVFSINLARKRI